MQPPQPMRWVTLILVLAAAAVLLHLAPAAYREVMNAQYLVDIPAAHREATRQYLVQQEGDADSPAAKPRKKPRPCFPP